MALPFILFDLDLLVPTKMMFNWVGGGIEAPKSQAGDAGALAFGPGGLLSLKYSAFLHAQSWREHLYLSQLAGILGTRVNRITVPILTDLIAPTLLPAGDVSQAVPFSDGALFTDGTGLAQPAIVAKMYSSASNYGNPVRIAVANARPLYGGEIFSINHSEALGERAYRIAWIEGAPNYDGAFTIYTAALQAPLKEAVSSDTPIRFSRPRCRMRLAPEAVIPFDVESWWRGNPEFAFLEG